VLWTGATLPPQSTVCSSVRPDGPKSCWPASCGRTLSFALSPSCSANLGPTFGELILMHTSAHTSHWASQPASQQRGPIEWQLAIPTAPLSNLQAQFVCLFAFSYLLSSIQYCRQPAGPTACRRSAQSLGCLNGASNAATRHCSPLGALTAPSD